MRRLYNRASTDSGACVTEKLFFGLTVGLIAACLPMWSCTLIADFSGPGEDKPDAATYFDAAPDPDATTDSDATTDPDATTDSDSATDIDSATVSDAHTEEDAGSLCGNGEIDEGEDCDDGALGNETCLTLGYVDGGDLSCNDNDCSFNATDCEAGDLSCMGVGLCYECCGWGNTDCHEACIEAGGGPLLTDFADVYVNLQSYCSNDCNTNLWSSDCYGCCDSVVPSCYDECKWGFNGTSNCSTVYECLKSCRPLLRDGNETSCPSDIGIHCFDGCVRTMDESVSANLFYLLHCMKSNCPADCSEFGSSDCQTCLTDSCLPEKDACQNDTE